MLRKALQIVALLTLFSGLLGLIAMSELPQDVSPTMRDAFQAVVNRISLGLTLGTYPFQSTPIELGPEVRTYLTAQQFTPPAALEAMEKGFPIERFETDQDYPIYNRTIPAGRYYLILWLSDREFERFGFKFLARTPLLLFVKEQGLELTEFGIACKVEVPVPNPNPDKVFPFTRTSQTCEQQASAATADKSGVGQARPRILASDIDHWGATSWGLGGVVVTSDTNHWGVDAKLKNACACEFPTKDQLFPKQEPEPPPPPPCDPCY